MTTPHRLPALQLSAAGVEPLSRTWNQVARVGEFKGHPQGEFAFTPEVFGRLVENFNATANGRVPVDYEHFSETLDGNVAQEGAPALAWVVALDNRGEQGLWGLFEWVDPTAVGHVKAGRYMYLSPAVSFNAVDRESGAEIGPRLTSVALTNHPFLDGMAPLVASEKAAALMSLSPDAVHVPGAIGAQPKEGKPMAEPDMMKRLKAAMKMADDAAEDAVMAAFEKVCAEHANMAEERSARLASEADALVKVRCSALTDEGRARAKAICLSDRASFELMFPAPAPAPAPTRKTEAETLLSERVAPAGKVAEAQGQDVEPEAFAVSDDHSALCVQLAEKLMAEEPKRFSSIEDAMLAASRTIREREVTSILSRMAGGR